MKTLTMIDLFSGCGGMTAGFKPHGFDPVLSVEWNLHAAATYAANFGEGHTFWGDIDDALKGDIPEADVVIGGPPCQGFSNLGSRDVNDPRNKLWKRYLQVVERAKPKVFVIENVERFKSSAEYQLLLDGAKNGLISDYELSPGVLLAADYGVGQRRPRTIIIGSRVGKIDLPKPTHAKVPTGKLKPWVTVRERFKGVPLDVSTTALPDAKTTFFARQCLVNSSRSIFTSAAIPANCRCCDTTASPLAEGASIFATIYCPIAGGTSRPARQTSWGGCDGTLPR